MAPLWTASELGLCVLDGDLMGRAYPELGMITPNIYGEAPTPCSMGDDKGVMFILYEMVNNDSKKAEQWLRKNITELGCDGGIASPLTKTQVSKYMIRNTLSHVWRLGRAILQARRVKRNPLPIIEKENGRLIFIGKIVSLYRLTQDGYNKGKAKISGLEQFINSTMDIEFQNENLVAWFYGDNKPEDKVVVATVPDIISVVDTESYQPFLVEDLKFGLRASVLVLPASPLMRTEQALKIIGPKGFGYDVDYKPVGDYVQPRSVIDEYSNKYSRL